MIMIDEADDVLSFACVQDRLTELMRTAPPVRTERWQGKDVSKDPAATTYELRNVCFEVDLQGVEDLDHWRRDIQPNLPWADAHFLERVGGEPLNPGVQWAHWPWAGSAAKFKTERFNHTYMQRLWPKFARCTDDGKLPMSETGSVRKYPAWKDRVAITGLGHVYGDLQNLVEMLAKEPYTRQAWIPLFFPEDTGVGDGGRKPCTLGYQILVRDGRAHIWYPLRSCDFIRHWRDDCYLAVRLLLWVIDRCRELNSAVWKSIVPGTYAMHTTSLHIFENDRIALNDKRPLTEPLRELT
jgi:hypothetical protein